MSLSKKLTQTSHCIQSNVGIIIVFLLMFSIAIPSLASAQWNPTGANSDRPRTVMKKSELPSMVTSLRSPANPERLTMYKELYDSANSPIAPSSASRQARSNQAKAAAFVVFVGLDKDLNPMTPQKITELTDKAIMLLEVHNNTVDSKLKYTEWQWRSKELINYLTAYDLLLGANVPADRLKNVRIKLEQFTGDLHSKYTEGVVGVSIASTVINNHSLMTAAAIGMGGVVLNDHKDASKWINSSMIEIHDVLFFHHKRKSGVSNPPAIYGYTEGPYYLKYAMKNMLPFFESLKNYLPDGTYNWQQGSKTRNYRHPAYNTDYTNLYLWANMIKLPDGRIPAIEDSFTNMTWPEVAIADVPGVFFTQTYKPISSGINEITDLRPEYLGSLQNPVQPTGSTWWLNKESGDIVYRSSWDPKALYLHIQAKGGRALETAGGHNQGDETSFFMFFNGDYVTYDPGYIRWDRRNEVANAKNHNLIYLDQNAPKNGDGKVSEGVEFLNNFDRGVFKQALIRSHYGNAQVTREFVVTNDKFVVINDDADLRTRRRAEFLLHGVGTYSQVRDMDIWDRADNTRLTVFSASRNSRQNRSTFQAVHETAYDKTAMHTALSMNTVSRGDNWISILYPHSKSATVDIVKATSMAAEASGATVTDSDGKHFAMGKANQLLITIAKAVSKLTQDVETDGRILIVSENTATNSTNIFSREALKLRYGNEFTITAKERAIISTTYNPTLKNYEISAKGIKTPMTIVVPVGVKTVISTNGSQTTSADTKTITLTPSAQPVTLIQFTTK